MRKRSKLIVSKLLLASTIIVTLSAPVFASTRTDLVRGFYFSSYGNSELIGQQSNNRLDVYRTQIPNATHAIATVHVRVPGGTHSNEVVRDNISENPEHLEGWFSASKQRGLKLGMAIILFSDAEWSWGGEWDPSDINAAFDSYYNAVQPYIQAAERAHSDFIIIADEWSTLYIKNNSAESFRSLVAKARSDYQSGWIGINVTGLEEPSFPQEIANLIDVIGITAYVPLSTKDHPPYEEMFNNLINPSDVPEVRSDVDDGEKTVLGRNDPLGYMGFLQALSAKWGKPLLLTSGYKSTLGAAKDPSNQPSTSIDNQIQADAWRAFIDAALDPQHGAGSTLYGVLGWQLWPGTIDDDNGTGFSVVDKPAANIINSAWNIGGDTPPPQPLPDEEKKKIIDALIKCLDDPDFSTCIREALKNLDN